MLGFHCICQGFVVANLRIRQTSIQHNMVSVRTTVVEMDWVAAINRRGRGVELTIIDQKATAIKEGNLRRVP